MRIFGWSALTIVMASVLAVLGYVHVPPITMTERWLADFRLSMLAQPLDQPSGQIVVVTVTEDTLKLFPYRSPLDRAFLAALLGQLQAKGAKAIGIDLLFDQPTEPDKDAMLAAGLASAQVPVLVAFARQMDGLTDDQVSWLADFVPPANRALANLGKDPLDGTARWVFMGRQDDTGWMDGLAPALLKRAGLPLSVKDTVMPAIRWQVPSTDFPQSFQVFPAHLVPVLPAAWIKDKVVLIGTDISLADRHRTPFSSVRSGDQGLMPGVLIHAQAMASLIDGRPDRQVGLAATILICLGAAILAVLAVRLPWGLSARLGVAVGLVGAGWALGFALTRHADLLVPLVAPSLSFGLAAWGLEVVGHRDAQQSRRFLKQAFAQYISPELVDQIVADPSLLSLSGEKREMTFLFTDVANFTTLAEGMDAATLTQVLNDYLDGVCAQAFIHGGTITDFIGDAVFATFGAPVPHVDHRDRALACALGIARFSRDFQARMQQRGIAFSHTRIGLHSGFATVGNIGSARRFKYAPVGDAVNTASRMEGLNKYFGTRICVSEATLTPSMRDHCRPMGRIVLKGRSQALGAWELLEEGQAGWESRAQYRDAYALLEADDSRADPLLGLLASHHEDDLLVRYHLDRVACGQRVPLIVMADK